MALNCINSEAKFQNGLYSEENLRKYIKEVLKYPDLSCEEELETAKLARAGSKEAREKLIKANLKLVVFTAQKVIHAAKLPMADLIQEGNAGLLIAIDKFNYQFGFRFASYAVWWIKQAMFKAVSEQSHSVKIPVYIQETLSRYSKIKREMEFKSNTPADIETIASKLKIDSARLNNYLNADKKTLSLEGDYEMQNGSEVRLIDVIEDKKSSVTKRIERENLKKEIAALISSLKDREQKVIMLRFGLEGGEKHTLEEIGRRYGVTKECIRQTEARALNRLRNSAKTCCIYNDYMN